MDKELPAFPTITPQQRDGLFSGMLTWHEYTLMFDKGYTASKMMLANPLNVIADFGPYNEKTDIPDIHALSSLLKKAEEISYLVVRTNGPTHSIYYEKPQKVTPAKDRQATITSERHLDSWWQKPLEYWETAQHPRYPNQEALTFKEILQEPGSKSIPLGLKETEGAKRQNKEIGERNELEKKLRRNPYYVEKN